LSTYVKRPVYLAFAPLLQEIRLMAITKKLNADELQTALQYLPGWSLNPAGRLEANFEFKTFPEAFSFMTRVAFEAETMDHHPDWSNSWNRVKIELTTHDSGGITEKDFELARKISAINWS
jgi:4a-hydroxytetrahydrobiopterin dehydratase